MSEIQLKVGGVYRNGYGDTRGLMMALPRGHAHYPGGYRFIDNEGRTYMPDGLYFRGIKTSLALVEVVSEPTEDSTEQPDEVNHPSHYTHGAIEVIDAIEAWKLPFHLANVVKYVARCEHKGSKLKDLQKALWYLDRHIQQLEKEADRA